MPFEKRKLVCFFLNFKLWTFKVLAVLKPNKEIPEVDVQTFAWSMSPAAPWPGQTWTSPSRLEQSWPRCLCRTCGTTFNSVIEAEAGTPCSLSNCKAACRVPMVSRAHGQKRHYSKRIRCPSTTEAAWRRRLDCCSPFVCGKQFGSSLFAHHAHHFLQTQVALTRRPKLRVKVSTAQWTILPVLAF